MSQLHLLPLHSSFTELPCGFLVVFSILFSYTATTSRRSLGHHFLLLSCSCKNGSNSMLLNFELELQS
ncbi:hypothetical protein QN277_010851 [Acacia crassicarpa]|uniref:Uncharacterized protein n=1 Tax=Acacia crassicarpa TaxID=499986 RepID=A0AAE1M4M4_9FABA|nr:hypothetical protein QN277_010851 [Acacia crassicarpa]